MQIKNLYALKIDKAGKNENEIATSYYIATRSFINFKKFKTTRISSKKVQTDVCKLLYLDRHRKWQRRAVSIITSPAIVWYIKVRRKHLYTVCYKYKARVMSAVKN